MTGEGKGERDMTIEQNQSAVGAIDEVPSPHVELLGMRLAQVAKQSPCKKNRVATAMRWARRVSAWRRANSCMGAKVARRHPLACG